MFSQYLNYFYGGRTTKSKDTIVITHNGVEILTLFAGDYE